MAKRSIRSARNRPSLFSSRRAGVPKARKWKPFGVVSALVLAGYLVVAYFVEGHELPALWQRLLGLGCLALAVLTYALLTRRDESPEELILRMRLGQHSDFGKLRRSIMPKQRSIRLPGLGEVSFRAIGGIMVFVLVAAWWLSPLAPVRVGQRRIEDLTVPLGQQVVAAVLVLPDATTAVLQPPIIPPHARQLGKLIDQNDRNSYRRGLKAIAEGRFEEARTLLAAAVRNREAQPVQVQIAQAQSDMYAGRFAIAADSYQAALEQGQKPGDPMLLCQAAMAWMQAGRFDRAAPLVAQITQIDQEKLAKQDPCVLAACLHVQALLDAAEGSGYAEAESLCQQTRTILEKSPARHSPFGSALVAASLNNQSILYALRANSAGAIGLNPGARQIWRATLGPNHPQVASGLISLAMIYLRQGNYAEAKTLIEAAAAVQAESLPNEHLLTAIRYNAVALLQRALGQYAEAQASAEKALEIAEKTIGPQSPLVVPILDSLACIYVDQSLYARAEAAYLRAVERTRDIWGPNHPHLAGILDHLGRFQLLKGRYDEAEESCDQAMRIWKETFGEKHPGVASALQLRGRLEIQRGRPRDARPYLEQALATFEGAFGKVHPAVACTRGDLAALDNSSRFYGKGVAGYKRAIETMKNLLGPEHARHPDVARLWLGLAALHVYRSKHAEAEPCLARALEIQQKSLPPFHPELAETLEAYAAVLQAKTPPDPDRAAAMLARARSIRQKHAEYDRPQPADDAVAPN